MVGVNRRLVWRAAAAVLLVLGVVLRTSLAASGGFPLHGTTPDPFVEASPLVIGVACCDGVLLLAVHTIFSESNNNNSNNNDDESFLLNKDDSNTNTDDDDPSLLDLPRSYRGPFRIYALDDFGRSAMVCAGWRTDGRVLADHLLSKSRTEQRVFGLPHETSNTGGFLADAASLFLAQSCLSESTRTLSCAGLLGSSTHSLWVVDATGAYAVRAHALGKGSRGANNFLRTKDWKTMECGSAKTELLRWLVASRRDGSDKPNVNENGEDAFSMRTEFPNGARVEIAMTAAATTTTTTTQQQQQHKPMKRLFAST